MMVVTPESHPHGVKCGVCREVIPYWNAYMSDVDSMTQGAEPIEEIRCVECQPL